jgi:hypothetical protein
LRSAFLIREVFLKKKWIFVNFLLPYFEKHSEKVQNFYIPLNYSANSTGGCLDCLSFNTSHLWPNFAKPVYELWPP